MSITAYLIYKKNRSARLPHHLASMTGPYLFRSEAQQFAHVIAAAAGIECQICTIEIKRLLGEVVRVDDQLLITNVWNIEAEGAGFVGEAIIRGRRRKLRRAGVDQMWQAEVLPL